MAERTTYTPGTFSWTDLATTDQEAAESFYAPLFGWEAQDKPVGDGIVYSMMLIDGKPVAAISPQPQAQRDAGVPPLWNSYITVESADGSLERHGSSAPRCTRPRSTCSTSAGWRRPGSQGAFVMVWEPKAMIGAALVNAPGALSWNELATADMDGSAQFDGGFFRWTTSPMEVRCPTSSSARRTEQ